MSQAAERGTCVPVVCRRANADRIENSYSRNESTVKINLNRLDDHVVPTFCINLLE